MRGEPRGATSVHSASFGPVPAGRWRFSLRSQTEDWTYACPDEVRVFPGSVTSVRMAFPDRDALPRLER